MRTCTIEGCDRKHQAKGLCHPHYNKLRDKSRHQKVATPCAVCGKVEMKYPTTKKRRQVCGPDCWYRLTFGRPRPGAELVAYDRPPTVRSVIAPTLVIPSSSQPFTSGACGWCGEWYVSDGRVTGFPSRWCSRACARRAGRAARRARESGSTGTYTWAEVIGVFLKLGRRCAYCDQVVDGQPDPDHVVPLSRGGRNGMSNIVPCCRSCNSEKGARTISEWVAWRAERGKPALPIDMTRIELRHLALDRPVSDAPAA